MESCISSLISSTLHPLLSCLPYLLPFCNLSDLEAISVVNHDTILICDQEWRLRLLEKYTDVLFPLHSWRRMYKLRQYFQKNVVKKVSARIYIMNGNGEIIFFPISNGKLMMCSRERALVYNRCERMFDLSLRINQSIQEISALIGMVSIDEARGLLNEHINLMASIASLRASLMFESELFQVFPAPVLLDTNSLLQRTFQFPDTKYLNTSVLMLQMWLSIDGLIYRPVAPPSCLHKYTPRSVSTLVTEQRMDGNTVGNEIVERTNNPPIKSYNCIKLHEIAGMTIDVDDDTMRYKLNEDTNELCVNVLVSNTLLLYLFNPLHFRPLDWIYSAKLTIGQECYNLPEQREGVFLNSPSMELRVFLAYGKVADIPERKIEGNDTNESTKSSNSSGYRGSQDSDPLRISYNGTDQEFSFQLTAKNRLQKITKQVVWGTSCINIKESIKSANGDMNRVELVERLIKVPPDGAITYCFTPNNDHWDLQYVEFAIGFESLLYELGVLVSNA